MRGQYRQLRCGFRLPVSKHHVGVRQGLFALFRHRAGGRGAEAPKGDPVCAQGKVDVMTSDARAVKEGGARGAS